MTSNRHAFVIGGDGGLASVFIPLLTDNGWRVTTTTRRPVAAPPLFLDLEQIPLLPDDAAYRGGVMFLLAAVTKVVDCEGSAATWRINADAPVELARQGIRLGMHVVFVSSDAVERAPHLAYAKQKAYAESYMLATGQSVLRPARILPDRRRAVAQRMFEIGASRAGGLYRWLM